MSTQDIDLELYQKYSSNNGNPSEPYKLYAPLIDPSFRAQFSSRILYRHLNSEAPLSNNTVQAQKYFSAAEAYAKAIAAKKEADDKAATAYDRLVAIAEAYDAIENAEAQLDSAQKNYSEAKAEAKKQSDHLIQTIAELCVQYHSLNPEKSAEATDDTTDVAEKSENFMRLLFPASSAIAIAAAAAGLPLVGAVNAYNWNGGDGVGGAAAVLFGKERSSLHNQIWDSIQGFSAFQLLAGTGLDLLHTVSGFGPAAFGALNAPTFAACMVLSAAQEGFYAGRAIYKQLSPDYFAEERRDAIEAELQLLTNKKEPPTMKELVKINKKITVLQKQAEALEYYADCKKNNDLSLEDKDDADKQKIELVQILMEKENRKAREHGIKCLIWTAAAAVMVTAAITCPPAVLVAGLVVGLFKAGQVVASMVQDDFTEEALQHAENIAGKGTDDLLAKALKAKGFNTVSEDINTLKESLSEAEQQELINEHARDKYDCTDYLSLKAKNIHSKVSNIGERASKAVCSFFRAATTKMPLNSAEPVDTFAMGGR